MNRCRRTFLLGCAVQNFNLFYFQVFIVTLEGSTVLLKIALAENMQTGQMDLLYISINSSGRKNV